MKKMLLLAAVAAVALSAAGGTSAAPLSQGAMSQGAVSAQPLAQGATSTVLYDQTSDDSYLGTISQNFESNYDGYDSQAADDFTVPEGKSWTITEVNANGAYFSGFGPAASVRVTIYKQKLGKPGGIVADFPALACKDYFGSFNCRLPNSVKLQAGTYWLSVQANLDYSVGGEWVWESQTKVQGSAAMWQNPGGAFGTRCVRFRAESRCIWNGQGDHMFKLLGKSD